MQKKENNDLNKYDKELEKQRNKIKEFHALKKKQKESTEQFNKEIKEFIENENIKTR